MSDFMRKIMACCVMLTLGACHDVPKEAYVNRGDPETLLHETAEIVTIDLAQKGALNKLSDLLVDEPPTRAELRCDPKNAACSSARGILDTFQVDAKLRGTGNSVALVYERVLAERCENRYIDNSVNGDNLHHPTFGCSLRMNTVQMVTDKKQFTNPNLMDLRDGEKAMQNYEGYLQPPPPPSSANSGLSQSLVSTGISTQ